MGFRERAQHAGGPSPTVARSSTPSQPRSRCCSSSRNQAEAEQAANENLRVARNLENDLKRSRARPKAPKLSWTRHRATSNAARRIEDAEAKRRDDLDELEQRLRQKCDQLEQELRTKFERDEQKLKTELGQLKERTDREMDEKRQALNDKNDALRAARYDLDDAKREYKKAENKITDLDEKLKKLEDKIFAANNKLDEQEDIIENLERTAEKENIATKRLQELLEKLKEAKEDDDRAEVLRELEKISKTLLEDDPSAVPTGFER